MPRRAVSRAKAAPLRPSSNLEGQGGHRIASSSALLLRFGGLRHVARRQARRHARDADRWHARGQFEALLGRHDAGTLGDLHDEGTQPLQRLERLRR